MIFFLKYKAGLFKSPAFFMLPGSDKMNGSLDKIRQGFVIFSFYLQNFNL